MQIFSNKIIFAFFVGDIDIFLNLENINMTEIAVEYKPGEKRLKELGVSSSDFLISS